MKLKSSVIILFFTLNNPIFGATMIYNDIDQLLEIKDLGNTNVVSLEIEIEREDLNSNEEYELPNQEGYIAFKNDTIYVVSPGINQELNNSITIKVKENLENKFAIIRKFDQFGQKIDQECIEITPIATNFSDINNHWAEKDILDMAKKGYLAGYEDGTFKPDNPMTREEFSAVIVRIFNVERTSYDNPFNDVELNQWYTDIVLAMHDAGLISGFPDGSFGVSYSVKNEDTAVIIDRIITTFNIVATQVRRANLPFIDTDQIADYAKPSVEKLYGIGLINGNPDGTYKPKNEATRAQISVLLNRLISKR